MLGLDVGGGEAEGGVSPEQGATPARRAAPARASEGAMKRQGKGAWDESGLLGRDENGQSGEKVLGGLGVLAKRGEYWHRHTEQRYAEMKKDTLSQRDGKRR